MAEKAAEVAVEEETREAPTPGPETIPLTETLAETPEPVPQPLFSPIRAAITVTLQTSELSRAADGATVLDEETLAARAIAEARQRYPEIPADLSPQSSFSRGSGEEEVITLTWEYEVPLSTSSGDQPVSSDP